MVWKAELVTGDDWIVTLNGRQLGQPLPRPEAEKLVGLFNTLTAWDPAGVYKVLGFLRALSSEEEAFLLGVL